MALEAGWVTPLEHRFREAQSKLSPRRRKLVDAIIDSAEDTYYLSSREMARRYNVDAATVVRTIQVLGYDQYSDFISDLRAHFVTSITPYRMMRSAAKDQRTLEGRVQQSLETDRLNVEGFRQSMEPTRVVELAKRLNKAQQVIVVGVDMAYSLSWFLAYGLAWLGVRAEAPSGSSGNIQHRVRALGAKDVLIAISFGRCLRDTVEAAQSARNQGAWTFGITDAGNSPIAHTCHEHWEVSVTNPSFNASYVAPMAAINTLLVAYAHVQSKRSLERLRAFDDQEQAMGRWFATPASDQRNGKR